MCLAQGHKVVMPVGLNPWPLDLESSTLPLNHCAPEPLLVSDTEYCIR